MREESTKISEPRLEGDQLVFEETGGGPPSRLHDVSEALNPGGGALLFGDCDWVRLPPELGGDRADIMARSWTDVRCPKCQAGGPIFTMVTDHDHPTDKSKVIAVMCCQSCKQYLWVGWERGRDNQGREAE